MTGPVRTIWVLLAFGTALGAPLLTYLGVILESDDVLYARLASDMAEGHPTFGINTHTYRLGFLVPMAALYHVFGVHDWTTVAFPLLSSLTCVLVAGYAADRLYGGSAGAWAALLCGFNPILYRFGSTGLADIPAGLLYGLFVVGWVLIVTNCVERRRAWALLSGLACAWAVATRESVAPMVLFTLAGFLFLGWRQATLREFPIKEWVFGCAAIAGPYLLSLWWYTGTPLYFLHAAQGGYNFAGAPWLQPLEGLQLIARLTGLAIIRASIEGYLFVALPVVVVSALMGSASGWDGDRSRLYLVLAVVSPLVTLSHFSTSFNQWSPIHLDLRFGGPILMPAGILVAGACLRLPSVQATKVAQGGTWVVLLLSLGLLGLGWLRQEKMLMIGAAATALATLSVFLVHRMPKPFVPAVLALLLVGNWGIYKSQEYIEIKDRNSLNIKNAAMVPWDPSKPILTDELTAQMLPYLHQFEKVPAVATWKGPGEAKRPFYWTERIDGPLAEDYLLVWNPAEAGNQAKRWGTEVPPWVLEEVTRGRLVKEFSGEPGGGVYQIGRVRER